MAKKAKKSKPPKGVPKKIWDRALEVFEDDGKMRRWFSKPNRGLGGRVPADVIKDGGADEIEAIFVAIEQGVFS